jgi:hypothetical protein
MTKHKKNKAKEAPATEDGPADPHDVLRRPAHPPRPHVLALLIALALFVAWFVYLVYVAVFG